MGQALCQKLRRKEYTWLRPSSEGSRCREEHKDPITQEGPRCRDWQTMAEGPDSARGWQSIKYHLALTTEKIGEPCNRHNLQNRYTNKI